MTLDNFVQKLKDKPYLKDMGAGKLSKMYKISRDDVYKAKEIAREDRQTYAKVLIFDVETTPLEAYVWATQVWKARISDDSIIAKWFCLSWSAKWLHSDDTMSMRVTAKEVKNEDDGRIMKGLWKLLNEADIVVAHNGGSFDVPNVNTRFILNELPPPRPYKVIDTLRVAQSQFGFPHNTLSALAKALGIEGKKETTYNLWKQCKEGNEEALQYMEEYNRQDVDCLEEVYLKLRPWIKNHPNVALYMDDTRPLCHVCGSGNVVEDHFAYTGVAKYKTYKCLDCGGAYSRGRKSVLSKEKKESLLTGIPRSM